MVTTPPAAAPPVAPVPPATLSALHPDCPDWRRLGPTPADAAIRAVGTAVGEQAAARDSVWSRGFNRRTLLKGGLGLGVAALGAQLATTRVAYADPGSDTNTLVVIFLRGGMDGLSVVVPAGDPDLLAARPQIGVPASTLLPFDTGFGLHPALAPLQSMISAGKVAAVPALSTPDLSRSHFQAQDCLEHGGAVTGGSTSGWLDNTLQQMGAGTTFRAVGVGYSTPRSLLGTQQPVVLPDVSAATIAAMDALPQTADALEALYTGLDNPLSTQVNLALEASRSLTALNATLQPPSARGYPDGYFAGELCTLASLIKGGLGVRVATVDVGGWDMHTGLGTVNNGDMKTNLGALASALAAFFADLGPAADSTTVVMMTEFGRRVQQNASNGLDHGHGSVLLALGAGLNPGVHGRWVGLSSGVLDQGDVPGTNDFRDVLSEVITHRLGLSSSQAGSVFNGWTPAPVGLMA